MREIKFREWHTGDWANKPQMIFDEKQGDCLVWKSQGQPITVMQYTGLKDKNGKEIYESDIVDWNDIKYKVCIGEFGLRDIESEGVTDIAYGVYGSAIGETLEPFCFDMQINSVWIKRDGIEVIGNIYENAELLEVSQ